MRTTLTLEDRLGARLKDLARSTGRSFKDVVNDVIRKGLSLGEAPTEAPTPFEVKPKACGLRPGIDPLKLNQVYDDLETEDFGLEVHEP